MAEFRHEGLPAHRQAVRGFVLRLVGDDALAEDLTQEALLRAQRAESCYRGEASERSWLCAIALNLVRDHFRAAARKPEVKLEIDIEGLAEPEGDDAEEALLQAEMSACMGEFVWRLPHPHSNVVALHNSAGLTHAEVATLLGISVANSRVLLHRGRAALREIMKQDCVLRFDGDSIPCERRPPPKGKK